MIDLVNKEFVNLGNNSANLICDIKEKNDIFEINLKLENLPVSEYAVVFIMDTKEYTSAIFEVKSLKSENKKINVEKEKVKTFDKIEIVDIYSGDVLFEYKKEEDFENTEAEEEKEIEIPFLKNNETINDEKEIVKEDITIIKEEKKENNNTEEEITNEIYENEDESFEKEDIVTSKEEKSINKKTDKLKDEKSVNLIENDNEETISLEEEIRNTEEDVDALRGLFEIFSPKNKNKSEDDNDEFEAAIDNISDDNADEKKNDEFEFVEEKTETEKEEIPKVVINANDVLVEDIMEVFQTDNLPKVEGDHKFFIVDETDKRLNDINIIYNGFVMPMLYPYMGYKNLELENAILPNWIFGKLFEDGEIKYYVYGILGSKNDKTQPFLGSTGFIYYEPSAYDGFGYWLMYISEKTGKICLL
ncbi:hypothetical protein [Anaerofustis stercorihominis]|uniref:hypothetical protein n=1 Tax=Anaerofustis stercorihominis TaxID=214853 RepID=UPI00214B6497|nr:hypothetical protein [Anaerofustis stercorihominis]MCR2031980.1 hypothetical protein [Anaerofustis stercorihominis]